MLFLSFTSNNVQYMIDASKIDRIEWTSPNLIVYLSGGYQFNYENCANVAWSENPLFS